MPHPVHRLVYYSRNRLFGAPETRAKGIRAILASARRNNPPAGVTGALMFNAGCFAQVLEGPVASVETIFETIQRDPRHGDISLLGFAPADGRAFGNWAMAFVGASIDDAARYGDIAADTKFDFAGMTAEKMFQTLKKLTLDEEKLP